MSSKIPFEEKLDNCLHAYRLPSGITKEEAHAQIMTRIHFSDSEQKSGMPVWFKLAAAVVILVVVSAAGWYLSGGVVIENTGTVMAQYILPDGSVVKLNQNSEAAYNRSMWFLNRNVQLNRGEAFFEVAEGERFTVETTRGDIKVLGTSFNVSLRHNNFQVACKSGLVEVKLPDSGEPVHLTSGTGIDVAAGNTRPFDIQVSKIGSWTIGEFTFENVPVTEVFETIHTQTDYDFEMMEEIDLKYSGQFNINQSIEEILDIVCIPLNLTYSIDTVTNKISITKI